MKTAPTQNTIPRIYTITRSDLSLGHMNYEITAIAILHKGDIFHGISLIK